MPFVKVVERQECSHLKANLFRWPRSCCWRCSARVLPAVGKNAQEDTSPTTVFTWNQATLPPFPAEAQELLRLPFPEPVLSWGGIVGSRSYGIHDTWAPHGASFDVLRCIDSVITSRRVHNTIHCPRTFCGRGRAPEMQSPKSPFILLIQVRNTGSSHCKKWNNASLKHSNEFVLCLGIHCLWMCTCSA